MSFLFDEPVILSDLTVREACPRRSANRCGAAKSARHDESYCASLRECSHTASDWATG